MIYEFNIVDIWRSKHPTLKQYTWHSSNKPPIFSSLDYVLVSDNLINSVLSCEHKTSYKSDHIIVILNIDLSNIRRGPGYFKLINSFFLETKYHENIRKSLTKISTYNVNANPNTLWELIKGTIRNETIKYGTLRKKENNENEVKLTCQIDSLDKLIGNTNSNERIEVLKQELDARKKEINMLVENKIDGYILRSKAQMVQEGEKIVNTLQI